MKRLALVALAILLPTGAFAGVPQDGPPDLDFQLKVDKAIEAGVQYLQGKRVGSQLNSPDHHIKDGSALILLTLIHAEANENDAHFQALLKEALEDKLERTYVVVLTAMALEELNRVKYQWRIHQCAQFLVDNLGAKGENRYGHPTDLTHIPKEVPTERKDVKTSGEGVGKSQPVLDKYGMKAKPKVQRRIFVKQRRKGKGEHDHSNMQYMALGLRACHDAGIVFEPGLIKKVRDWWVDHQNKATEPAGVLVVNQPKKPLSQRVGNTRAESILRFKATPRGWSYQNKGGGKNGFKGSMTAGAIGALCILDYILGKDWRTDQSVLDGMMWMAKNFAVEGNPVNDGKSVDSGHWHYYYLYGMERAGMLFGTETIGTHKWYREGAEYLLQNQSGGGWGNVKDTCFAILFLKRATHRLPPVATGYRR